MFCRIYSVRCERKWIDISGDGRSKGGHRSDEA